VVTVEYRTCLVSSNGGCQVIQVSPLTSRHTPRGSGGRGPPPGRQPGERPRERGQGGEAGADVRPVGVVAETGGALNPPHHDMMQRVRRIETGLPGHTSVEASTTCFTWQRPVLHPNTVLHGRLLAWSAHLETRIKAPTGASSHVEFVMKRSYANPRWVSIWVPLGVFEDHKADESSPFMKRFPSPWTGSERNRPSPCPLLRIRDGFSIDSQRRIG